jgi:hypothetical protein
VKIHVAAVEALRKKERQGRNSENHQNRWFSEFHPLLKANVFFCRFFLKSHPVYDQTQGTGAVGAVFSCLYGYLYYLFFLNSEPHPEVTNTF